MKKIITMIIVALVGVAIFPTTLLLFAGMAPSIGAFLVDKTKERLKGMTVGSLNFAACFPYWLTLVSTGHTVEIAWDILTPVSMIIMYSGAIVGFIVEWGVSVAVAVLMIQKAKIKLRSIKKQRELLIERWGREVTGDIPLDEFGFPLK